MIILSISRVTIFQSLDHLFFNVEIIKFCSNHQYLKLIDICKIIMPLNLAWLLFIYVNQIESLGIPIEKYNFNCEDILHIFLRNF